MLEILYSILVVIGVACIAAGLVVSYSEFMWRKWAMEHNKQSWLLDTLLVTNVIQDAVGLYLLTITFLRMGGTVLPDWVSLLTIIGLSLLFGKKVWRHHMVLKHADRELTSMLDRREE